MSKENELKLSAPWIIFYKEIKALFDRDPEIRAVFDSVTMTIKLYCNSTSAKIEALIAARKEARANKNWAESDRIRDELAAMNVVIKDSKEGTTWEIKA